MGEAEEAFFFHFGEGEKVTRKIGFYILEDKKEEKEGQRTETGEGEEGVLSVYFGPYSTEKRERGRGGKGIRPTCQ